MNISIILLLEFFKVGLFAIGGGLATLPFLYNLGIVYHWFDTKNLAQMLAISNIVPGPVGVNLAGLVGFKANGFLGALIAILGIMIPSIIFVLVISKILKTFEGNRFVKSIFYMLKPASCAMIVAIGIKLLANSVIKTEPLSLKSLDLPALILFLGLIALSFKSNRSPLFYLGLSAIIGMLLQVAKVI